MLNEAGTAQQRTQHKPRSLAVSQSRSSRGSPGERTATVDPNLVMVGSGGGATLRQGRLVLSRPGERRACKGGWVGSPADRRRPRLTKRTRATCNGMSRNPLPVGDMRKQVPCGNEVCAARNMRIPLLDINCIYYALCAWRPYNARVEGIPSMLYTGRNQLPAGRHQKAIFLRPDNLAAARDPSYLPSLFLLPVVLLYLATGRWRGYDKACY